MSFLLSEQNFRSLQFDKAFASMVFVLSDSVGSATPLASAERKTIDLMPVQHEGLIPVYSYSLKGCCI